MSDAWRTRLGILLILLGVAGIIVGFGPLQFGDRLSGRVDATGTVQWGVQVDAISPDDAVSDGEYGAWKVDYEIDGSGHTGVLIGEYYEGQTVTVSAPPDGSIYSMLREGTPLGLKILSWFVMPLSLALVVIGGWWLRGGLRAQDAHNREVARQQLARHYPHLFPPAPAGPAHAALGPQASQSIIPQASQPGIPQAPPEPGRSPAPPHDGRSPGRQGPDFFAPYDI